MKKKILTLFLLMALCLPVICIESFNDKDYKVYIAYNSNNVYGINWKQVFSNHMHNNFLSNLKGWTENPVNKLSNEDIRLINKALQNFEVAKDEIYFVNMVPFSVYETPLKSFYVLITTVNGENYYWEAVGNFYTLW